MSSLATLARQNRKTALEGLARRRSANIVSLASRRDREKPVPMLDFGARRRACAEASAQLTQATMPLPASQGAETGRHALLLVSDRALPRAA